MGGEVFNEIDAILNQYFNKVRKDMVQKFVTADRFITTTAICLLAPSLQTREKFLTVPSDTVSQRHRCTCNIVRIFSLPMAGHYIACLRVLLASNVK